MKALQAYQSSDFKFSRPMIASLEVLLLLFEFPLTFRGDCSIKAFGHNLHFKDLSSSKFSPIKSYVTASS